jgi:sugar phosphate isomerase/epimerase
MNPIGIFAKTFVRPTVESVFAAVRSHGLRCTQFNLACAGLASMPDAIDPATRVRIGSAARQAGVHIAALSGTYNMIHPDRQERSAGLRCLRVLAQSCNDLGTQVISLCTGTRDPAHMWRWHPDNDTSEAWDDLLQSMQAALQIAEENQVVVAFEPEQANVVNSAARGLALIQAMQSSRLKVIIDGANLITPGENQNRVLAEAFDLLGEHIIIAHAKDRSAAGGFLAAGQGILDYDEYLRQLKLHTDGVPLILHGLTEQEVEGSLAFLKNKFAALDSDDAIF